MFKIFKKNLFLSFLVFALLFSQIEVTSAISNLYVDAYKDKEFYFVILGIVFFFSFPILIYYLISNFLFSNKKNSLGVSIVNILLLIFCVFVLFLAFLFMYQPYL